MNLWFQFKLVQIPNKVKSFNKFLIKSKQFGILCFVLSFSFVFQNPFNVFFSEPENTFFQRLCSSPVTSYESKKKKLSKAFKMEIQRVHVQPVFCDNCANNNLFFIILIYILRLLNDLLRGLKQLSKLKMKLRDINLQCLN